MLSLALFAVGLASAGTIPLLGYSSWADGQSMVGVDGWVAGYSADSWRGLSSDGRRWVQPTTDDNGGSFGAGDGGPADNWLIQRSVAIGEGYVQTRYYTVDDDTLGLVTRGPTRRPSTRCS